MVAIKTPPKASYFLSEVALIYQLIYRWNKHYKHDGDDKLLSPQRGLGYGGGSGRRERTRGVGKMF
jgi:hypothetical protein